MNEIGDIIKSGGFDKIADVFQKLAGPLAEELGLMFGDKARVYRVRNLVKVIEKTQKILADSHLSGSPVPPRIFLPIIESASLEDDDYLQMRWAGLLASASADPQSLSPAFVEILKELTPGQAKALEDFFESNPDLGTLLQVGVGHKFHYTFSWKFEDDGKEANDWRLFIETYERLGIFSQSNAVKVTPANDLHPLFVELDKSSEVTQFGVRFMVACRGPLKEEPN